MRDSEIAEVVTGLEQLLLDRGLGVVVEQVRAEVSSGRIEQPPPRERGPRAAESELRQGEVRIVPLTQRERLGRMLDLTEIWISGSLLVEDSVRDLARSLYATNDLTSVAVSFSEPDELDRAEDDEGESWELEAAVPRSQRVEGISEVIRVITAIREEAEVDRGVWLRQVPAGRQPADERGWIGQ